LYYNYDIAYFVDSFRHGRRVFFGEKTIVETHPPQKLLTEKRGSFIVLTGIYTEPAKSQVEARLKEMGFASETDYLIISVQALEREIGGISRFEISWIPGDEQDERGNRLVIGDKCVLAGFVEYQGENNTVKIGNAVDIGNLHITIKGNNCLVQIDDHVRTCTPGGVMSIYADRQGTLKIGKSTTFYGNTQFSIVSDTIIGEKCMFAREVFVGSLDFHSIYDLHSGEKISRKKNIHINDRVWVGQGAKILGNAQVGANSIIGSYAVVARAYPNNCAIAGNPAKIVRKDIVWHSLDPLASPQNIEDFPIERMIQSDDMKMTTPVNL
jgi:acetyltransferase-like isoleucine patch superfamily enzyme